MAVNIDYVIEKEPAVSVIIPVFNDEDYIEKCLDSVVSQSLKDIEIICIDDGSSDISPEILIRYAKKDKRIIVIEKEHTNAGEARNEGLKIASGEYLAFVDADDFIEANMLENALNVAKVQNAEIVHFGCNMWDHQVGCFKESPWMLREWEMPEVRPFSASDVSEKIFNMGSCTPCDKLFKRDFIVNNRIVFQSNTSSNDMLFTYAALSRADRITTLPDILYHLRIGHPRVLSENVEKMSLNFSKALTGLKSYLESNGSFAKYRRSYLNWAVDFSLWNYKNFGQSMLHRYIGEFLKKKLFNELCIYDMAESEFYNHSQYEDVKGFFAELKKDCSSVGRPMVSVIVPVYNSEDNLRSCLDSLIYQTYSDIEIICINDCSSDGTKNILDEYKVRDNRFLIIDNKKYLGHGASLNIGLKKAKSDYVVFVDPNDFVDVLMVETLLSKALKYDLDFVRADVCSMKHDKYGKILPVLKRGINAPESSFYKIIHPSEIKYWRNCYYYFWSSLYKKEMLLNNSVFFNEDEDAPFNDVEFNKKILFYYEKSMYVPEELYFETVKSFIFSGYPMLDLL